MSESWTETQFLQHLNRFRAGDESALNELLDRATNQLTALTRHMLSQFPGVQRWEETDDVLQNALVRLLRALKEHRPESLRRFYGLASLQIRRELIDMARHYYGPLGLGANHASGAWMPNESNVRFDAPDTTLEPSKLAEWCELHQHINNLRDNEREVVELVLYQGLNQQQVAELLDISVRTVQRRWHDALLELHRLTHDG